MADGLYADGGTSLALLTDMYQITMAQGYWKLGKHTDYSVFHLYYRKPPFGGTYVVSAGLDTALEYLSRWGFSESDISYLRGLRTQAGGPVFEEGFLAYLATLKVNVTIHGVPEGELVFPNEPILRVEGPLLECQILETPLLTILGFQSLVATKTTRVCQAAAGTEVMDFGLRRAHGPDGGVSMSRAAFVGGCCGTSNMLAGKLFGIPVLGTHSHSWVMSFEDEEGSFDDFSLSAPDNTVCLVDTYDTLRGVEKAIRVGLRMKEKGSNSTAYAWTAVIWLSFPSKRGRCWTGSWSETPQKREQRGTTVSRSCVVSCSQREPHRGLALTEGRGLLAGRCSDRKCLIC
eukprot:Rhum_TRINITY_DN14928_c4_g1::Rhum_TRINITY_DN14928_c4_g1_i1::g.128541::m.128541/K00763/pncB, NAPRT1; nicotinate phosphoribosyltransferase